MVRDFSLERRTVWVGGSRFRVSKPTVEAIILFMVRFHGELKMCWDAHQEAPLLWDQDQVGNALQIFLRDTDTALQDVLQTIVKSDQDIRNWPLRQLVLEVLQGCDLKRIVESLNLDELFGDKTQYREGVGLDQDLSDIGKVYHIDPKKILKWPWEMYLSIRDILTDDKKPTTKGAIRMSVMDLPPLSGVVQA